jgi:acetyl esterase/lipase
LIIWAHGGAFFQGTKNDGDMQFFTHRFTQRGYVCASINYRLASSIVLLYDSAQIFKYTYQGVADFKAAIRYFYKDAANGNHWNIDTNAIFIAGNSAGAIAADFITLLDSLNELSPAYQTIVTANGGIDGNSGNDAYSTKVSASASLAGAVISTDWIKPGATPMILCQGTADATVPYNCGQALTQYTGGLFPTINMCGSGQMAPALTAAGDTYSFLPFPGSAHVPWDTNVVIANRTDSAVAAFFYTINCTQAAGHCNQPLGSNSVLAEPQLLIYPNPASDHIQIAIQDQNQLSSYSLSDYTGREIINAPCDGKETSLSVKGLSPGIYILQLHLKNTGDLSITKKIIIE